MPLKEPPTPAILGEAGPEAGLPLGSGAGLGVNVSISFAAGSITVGAGAGDPKAMFSEFAETIADEVQRVIAAEHRRSAVV